MKNISIVFAIFCLLFLFSACEKTELVEPQLQNSIEFEQTYRMAPDDAEVSKTLTKDKGHTNSLATFVEGGGVQEISSSLCTIDISKGVENSPIQNQVIKSIP